MKSIQKIELLPDSNEELLPGFSPEFPYISTCAELDKYLEPSVPWHWHPTVELFYMERGCLEYTTPGGTWVFPQGSGGFVNANVLHSTSFRDKSSENIQLLHLYDPVLLAGEHGSRMEAKYIRPLTASSIEIIPLYPQEHGDILRDIRDAFDLSDTQWGYEFALRKRLSAIWLKLYELARPDLEREARSGDGDGKVKAMMAYIHEHFSEPISVEELASAAHVSKRVCFRLFREHLHMTPVEYMTGYRLRRACRMLTGSGESVTQIAYACGLGSSSYFGKLFRDRFGSTPAEYRRNWHDHDKICRD